MAITDEITVVISRDKVKATSKLGAARSGPVRLDQLRLATIRAFEEMLLEDQIKNRRHMEVLGQHLYAAILEGEVGQLIDEKRKEVGKNDRLRLQLQFDPDVDREIASLPWEFLYSPTQKDFLATDANLVLSRYLELVHEREIFNLEERPLRTLVVISRPNDERPVLAKEVVDVINGLNLEGHEPIVAVEVVKHTTLQGIEDALREHQPHIFHFIGHGNYNPNTRTGSLKLVNSANSASEACDDSTLIERFRDSHCFPRLVFLHMCEGGVLEKDSSLLQAFSGFAPKLIHARIPTVVAMQYPIRNEDAREFSKNFYFTLAEGGSVDEAVQEGRRRLDLNRKTRLFGTPILFMHSATTLVLPKQRRSDSNQSNAPSEQKTDSPPDNSLPTQVTETASPLEPSPNALNLAISGGFQAARTLPEENRASLRKQLMKMNAELKGKTKTEIFNAVFDAWEAEPNSEIKSVWDVIMKNLL